MKRNPVDALIKRSAARNYLQIIFPTNKHANPRNLRQALNYILNSKVIKIIAPRVLYARAKWYNNNFGTAFLPNRISEFSTAPRARLAPSSKIRGLVLNMASSESNYCELIVKSWQIASDKLLYRNLLLPLNEKRLNLSVLLIKSFASREGRSKERLQKHQMWVRERRAGGRMRVRSRPNTHAPAETIHKNITGKCRDISRFGLIFTAKIQEVSQI